MRYINNKKYQIQNSNNSVICKDKQFYLLAKNGCLVFGTGFKKIYIIYNGSKRQRHGCVLLLLVSSDNTASVYDLNNNKMLEDSFTFKAIKYIDGSAFTCNSFDKEYGIIYEITDTKRNIYNYSTEKGFIFGPIPYRKAKKHAFGYVVNNHLLHYFYGQEDDLNNYIKISESDGYEFYTGDEHCWLYIFSSEFGLEKMDSHEKGTFFYYDSYHGIDYKIVAKYNSAEEELEVDVERIQERYDDYDILSDGFGGDAEAFSSCFSDGY